MSDSNWGSTVLAMHMDDTTLSDLKGKVFSATGGVVRSSSGVSPFSAGYSAYFPSAGSYLNTTSSLSDFVFGTGDFTIELFVKTTASNRVLLDFYTGAQNGWQLLITSSGYLQLYVTSVIKTGSIAVNTGGWVHVAIVRASGSLTFFINGVADGSATSFSTNLSYVTSSFSIGAQVASRNAAYDFLGNICDLRITKGIARTISLPTAPFSIGPVISGIVKGVSGFPEAATVRVYRRDTGALVSQVTSDAVTGAYTAPAYDTSAHTVVRLVSTSDNAQIFDNVLPT